VGGESAREQRFKHYEVNGKLMKIVVDGAITTSSG
jgi:hypothetical protein